MHDARPQDAAQLTRLVRDSAAYAGEYQAMVADDTLSVDYLNTHLVRVARDDNGTACGFYAVLTPGRGIEGEAELEYLFVDNDQQGRGIGRLLFEDMRGIAAARGLHRVHIVSHPPSEPFYLARGARRAGAIPPYERITWSRPHLMLDVH